MPEYSETKSVEEGNLHKKRIGLHAAHGSDTPEHIAAGADAARDVAAVLLLLWAILYGISVPIPAQWLLLSTFGVGWVVWKSGRNAWLGWARLEQLHRIIEQEKWEIEHHRPQEREAVMTLYRLKGFEGPLLDEVVDFLMADNDRLLRIMLEEELGVPLASYEHPLKQAVGSAVGGVCALLLCGVGFVAIPRIGLLIGALVALGCASIVGARRTHNRVLPAIVWALALGALTWAVGTFLLQFLL